MGADRARDEMSQHSGGTATQDLSAEPATDWRTGSTATEPSSAFDPEATQHMPPPAAPNR